MLLAGKVIEKASGNRAAAAATLQARSQERTRERETAREEGRRQARGAASAKEQQHERREARSAKFFLPIYRVARHAAPAAAGMLL